MIRSQVYPICTFVRICSLMLITSSCGITPDGPSSEQVARFCAQQHTENLEDRAKDGDPEAQFQLGNLYCLPGDVHKRVDWYRKASDQGHGQATFRLAQYYRYDLKDIDQALILYRRSAEQGEVQAMKALGEIYYYGTLVPKNPAEAAKWYKSAAASGSYSSIGMLDKIMGTMEQTKKGQRASIRKSAENLFGSIKVLLSEADINVESPVKKVEGTRYKGLLAIGSIPGSIAVYGTAGILMAPFMPFAALALPSERKVRDLQEKFSAAYQKFGDKNLLANMERQVVWAMRAELPNLVVSENPPNSTDNGRLQNADTKLEIESIVSGLRLTKVLDERANVDERAQFLILMTYRLTRTSDDVVLAEDTAGYASQWKNYAEWTRDNGAILKEETKIGYSETAKGIVSDLWRIARHNTYL